MMNIADLLLICLQQAGSPWTGGGADSRVPGQKDGFELLLQETLQRALRLDGTAGAGGPQDANVFQGLEDSPDRAENTDVSGAGRSGGSRKALAPLIASSAGKYGIDPALVRQVVKAESGYDSRAVSPAGAEGLMQLMPATARAYGVTDALDPAQNIDGGTHFLRDLLQRYQGNVPLALAAYNAGPGAVEKYGGIPPYAETQSYVRKILAGLGGLDRQV
ncbi:soluble lytic murein transglycosylase precursor [Peptococcaceae bacterium CEB3]|nr:soluble lytic murein transglycosylase precursor [Peptococcaceae bacterium CEB3]